MKKILITGSSGFIGSALKLKLSSIGYEILEFNTKVGNISDKNIFNGYQTEGIAYVFHLAAKTYVPDSWTDTFDFYNTNVIGTENVLEFCRRKEIPLTFVSSYLYGQPEKLPISESHIIVPNNPYAHSKYLAEQLCEFYAKEFGVNTVIIRPFNAYGVGQSGKFLIPSVIRQAIAGDEIKVKDLTPRRDYIYIDDLIDALVLTMRSLKRFSVYNIGSGYSVSVKDVIDTVQSILGTDKKVIADNIIRKNEINDVIADISKAKKELGWYPSLTFYDGIKRMIEYELGISHAGSANTN